MSKDLSGDLSGKIIQFGHHKMFYFDDVVTAVDKLKITIRQHSSVIGTSVYHTPEIIKDIEKIFRDVI